MQRGVRWMGKNTARNEGQSQNYSLPLFPNMKLQLLFTKDGLLCREVKGRAAVKSEQHLNPMHTPPVLIQEALEHSLHQPYFTQIEVISAINHFAMMPSTFSMHEKGMELIAYNAAVQPESEELMLSVNMHHGVQYYFTLPKHYYHRIKERNLPTSFHFSGERFLKTIEVRNKPEIHIHLYHQQCEFLVFEQKKILLYNHLDRSSEVDFLYFIMFTVSRLGFELNKTYFYLYGEIKENETFVSELRKFASHLKIIFENTAKKHILLD